MRVKVLLQGKQQIIDTDKEKPILIDFVKKYGNSLVLPVGMIAEKGDMFEFYLLDEAETYKIYLVIQKK